MIKHNGNNISQYGSHIDTEGPERLYRFLSWASERIKKEMDTLKSNTKESRKTLEDIKPAPVLKRGRKKFAEDKTQKIVSEVEKLREQGLSIPDACKKVGTSTASYYAWRT